jgi:hypothetical protein
VFKHNHVVPVKWDSKFHTQTKLSHSWPGQARRAPGVCVSQNLYIVGTWRYWGYTYASASFICRSYLQY